MKGKVIILSTLFVAALLFSWVTIPTANAEKMTLSLVDWHEPRMILYEKKTKEYEQVNPEVKIETTIIPWSEFWQKALAGAAAGQVLGDVMQFHNAQTSTFMGLLEPYPEDLFPLDEMREEFFAFDQAYVFDGEFYFYPGGIMSPLMFYNKKMWDESGIAEFPKTWEDLRATAKKLTKYSETGEIDIAGLAFNGAAGFIWDDFNYQMGGWTYSEEGGTRVEWDTEEGRKVATFIWELMFKDKVNSPGFLDWSEAFGTEKSAMVYGWTWFRGWMDVTYPDVEYIVSVLPTPDGDMCPAVARNNYECELAIPKATPEDKKKEGFKFIKWLFDDDQLFIDMNIALARVPGRLSLWDDPQITGDKVLGVLAKQVPYTVFPGEYPARISDPLTRMEDAIRNEMDPLEALKMAEEDANMLLADKPVDWVVERQYSPPCE